MYQRISFVAVCHAFVWASAFGGNSGDGQGDMLLDANDVSLLQQGLQFQEFTVQNATDSTACEDKDGAPKDCSVYVRNKRCVMALNGNYRRRNGALAASIYCQATCGICEVTTTTTTASGCEDDDNAQYGASGNGNCALLRSKTTERINTMCVDDPDGAGTYCRKTCNLCTTTTTTAISCDDDDDAQYGASGNGNCALLRSKTPARINTMCEDDPDGAGTYCRKTCNLCTTTTTSAISCEDDDDAQYGASGNGNCALLRSKTAARISTMCEDDPDGAGTYCPKTCNLCQA